MCGSIQEQRLVLHAAIGVKWRCANHVPLFTNQLRCVQ
jgi:hypothetical protein